MNKKDRRIAILGAGGTGSCAALELSQRGYKVDLYESSSLPVSKASYANEGKIHLGFIYAMDKELHTAREMMVGALHFVHYLKRWIDLEPKDVISTPFHYLVHKGSLMDADELTHHYEKCMTFFEEAKNHFKLKYLDLFDSIYARRMTNAELDAIADREYITAAYTTNEHAIDPRPVAGKLRDALSNEPAINLLLDTAVERVTRKGSKLVVHSQISNDDSIFKKAYTDVINATWNGRLKIDNTMGIPPPAEWSFRYKFANKVLSPLCPQDLPSVTMVQGPFGDTVNFGDNGMFLSWYPIGRTGWSEDLCPPDWDAKLTDERRRDIFRESLEQISLRIPSVKHLPFKSEDVDPVGGVIYALGNREVDQIGSKLHTRHQIGITSRGNYHSVNTGKYTMVPYWGVKIADRIENIG